MRVSMFNPFEIKVEKKKAEIVEDDREVEVSKGNGA